VARHGSMVLGVCRQLLGDCPETPGGEVTRSSALSISKNPNDESRAPAWSFDSRPKFFRHNPGDNGSRRDSIGYDNEEYLQLRKLEFRPHGTHGKCRC
jgi:hypothetical protein